MSATNGNGNGKAAWRVEVFDIVDNGDGPEVYPGEVRTEELDAEWPGEAELNRVFAVPGCESEWIGGRLLVSAFNCVPLGTMTRIE